MAIKFISNYWRKFERPTFEKLNDLLSSIVAHVQKRRDLSRRAIIYTDPSPDMEHWASAIRTVGRYSDVQDAIDHAREVGGDTKIPYATVALESKRDAITADYYIDDTGDSAATQIMSALNAVPTLGTVFFHAGEYTFKTTVTIPKRLSIVGEPGTIFYMMAAPTAFASLETAQCTDNPMRPVHISGIVFVSSRRVLKGSGLDVQDCTFVLNNANLSATEGIIETVDLGDTYPIPSHIKGCTFYVSSLAAPSQLYVPSSCVILHSFGGLLIEDSDVRHYDGLQWFRRGVIAQTPQEWIRIVNTDIRAFEESVDVSAGNVYLEDSRLYREGEIV